jgi:hypothetical protein
MAAVDSSLYSGSVELAFRIRAPLSVAGHHVPNILSAADSAPVSGLSNCEIRQYRPVGQRWFSTFHQPRKGNISQREHIADQLPPPAK